MEEKQLLGASWEKKLFAGFEASSQQALSRGKSLAIARQWSRGALGSHGRRTQATLQATETVSSGWKGTGKAVEATAGARFVRLRQRRCAGDSHRCTLPAGRRAQVLRPPAGECVRF
jgi:hypothetical protein